MNQEIQSLSTADDSIDPGITPLAVNERAIQRSERMSSIMDGPGIVVSDIAFNT